MTRRFMAFVLAFLMLFSSVPSQVFATSGTDESTVVTTTDETTPAATEETTPDATEETDPHATEETAPDATEETAPDATEETAPDATEETAPDATEETVPELVVEETVPAMDTPPAQAVYNLGWDYANIEKTASGHTFTDPAEDHYGSHVTVSVNGAPVAEGGLLEGVLNADAEGTVTINAADGYAISNVVLAFYESAPFSGTPTYTESAFGFMSESSGPSAVTIPLNSIYDYLMEGDPANIYLMVELTPGEEASNPEIDTYASGSNLGWEIATITTNSSGGYSFTDNLSSLVGYVNVSFSDGSYYTSTSGGGWWGSGTTTTTQLSGSITEGRSNAVANAISATASGQIIITTAYPYYITEVVLACGDNKNPPNPWNCRTVGTEDAHKFVLSGSTPTREVYNLSDIRANANHASNDNDYFLMVEIARLPDTVYVGYNSGSAGSNAIAAVPVVETGAISGAQAQVGSYKTWAYSTSGTSAPVHDALGISPEAEAEANSYGYSFAGWHLDYYTGYDTGTNEFSGTKTTGGTNLPQGHDVTLIPNAKLTAIWQPMHQIELEKVWANAAHPDSVTVNILKNGVDSGIDVVLNEANNWKTVLNVPSKDENGNAITYTVSEDIPSGYQCVIASVTPSNADYEYSFKLTNSRIMSDGLGNLSITGEKIWVDGDNAESVRPGSVEVILYANGTEIGRQTVTADSNWKYTFNVAIDASAFDADTVTFTVGEEAVAGYELTSITHPSISFTRPSISGGWTKVTPCSELTYQNTATAKTVVAAKMTSDGTVIIWSPDALAQFERDLIVASLEADANGLGNPKQYVFLSGEGTSTAYGLTVNSANLTFDDPSNWSMFWTGTYSRGSSASTASSITNALANVYVGVRKVWEDDHDRDGLRPDSITVELYADGTATGETLTMSESNNWTAQWENLPKYKNGVEIEYSVVESATPANYDVDYSVDTETGTHVITNTHNIATTSITATKAWSDNNDQDGLRPDSVTLAIYANGVSTGKTVNLTAANDWTAVVDGLPLNESGTPITYTLVEETAIEGYTASTSGTTVTNTHTPATVDIPVTKTWSDNEDQDGFRPDSVTVRLLADGTEVKSMVITEAADWKGVFTGLPKFRDGGTEIVYTVTEDAVEHYTTAISGYSITNTHVPETCELTVTKVWDDLDNQDGKRADSVDISLFGNDKTTPLATVTLSESNSWTASWSDLPKYSGGTPITYTVEEVGSTKGGAAYSVIGAGYTIIHTYNNEEGSPFWTLATVTNKYTPESVGLDVQKNWEDVDNQDGIRPASVTVELYYKVGEAGTWTATGKTLVLNPANEWDDTFTGLPKYAAGQLVYYKVVEEAVDGYTTTYSVNNTTYVATVTNTHIPANTAVKVAKVWNDNDNQDGIRPASVTVSLYGRDKTTALDTVTLSDANSWTHTWNDLPKNYAGNPIVYTVEENEVTGYTAEISRSTSADEITLTVTNSHTTETVSFPFSKVWEDAHNQDGIRPESVTVTLYADGTAVQTKTITAADNWHGIFTDLPKNKGGAAIVYTIGEATVAGYTSSVSGSTITNTHTPEQTSVTVNKVWDDANNQDGKRPASIQITLYANNVEKETATMTPDAGGNWSYTFTGLPKYAAGKAIDYTVSEAVIGNGYTSSVDGLTITNSRTPETTAITVTKTWDDNNDQDGIRPTTVTVHLLADGVVVATDTFDVTNGWSTVFANLPVYKNGSKIVYTVTEDAVTGYSTSIDGFAITNKHVPSETSVTVAKTWDDADNQDGIRPASVTLVVSGTDGSSRDVVLSDSNSWTATVSGLPEYANGTKIVYTVSEPTVASGYTVSVSGNTVTNKHIPATVDIPVTKVWDDANDQDGKRPASVTVNLLADGTKVDSVVLNADNLWQHVFAGKAKFKAGTQIVYTLEEEAVAGYTADIDNATGIITNTYTPETINVVANKIWDDKDDQDGKRPTSIILHLLASGEHTGMHQTVTPDASGNWNASWTGLPKYADGQLIRYTVTEQLETGSDYYVSYEHNRTDSQVTAIITNTYEPEKTAVTIEKLWRDTYNQDGLRPDSITVELLADDAATGITATLHKDHGWITTVTGLDKYNGGKLIVYTVVETGVPTGYTVTYGEDSYSGDKEVINTHNVEKTSVSVTKVWNDANDQDGIRPDGVTVTLYRNGVASTDPAHTVVLNDSNSWTYTFTNLDVHYGIAVDNIYTVVETVPEGYTAVTTGSAAAGYTITNTHVTETVDIPVTKVWDDAHDQDGIRPASITVKLLADGTEVDSAALTAADNWAHKFTGLPKFRAGKEITYTLDEVAVDGYTTVISGYTITNTHIPEEISITATKVWNDNNNQDGKRPASITLHLLADGYHTGKKAVLTPDASGNWNYTWTGLAKYADGHEIAYSLKEETIGSGYHTTISGYTVTNTYEPEKISVNVWKKWVDNNDQDGIRPASIDVTLYANGVASQTITLTAADHWQGGFANLDRYAGGKLIEYTVKETAVEGYSTLITGDADAGFEITNTHETKKTSVSVSKVWNDENDRDGSRPADVTVTLYQDGEAFKTAQLNQANGWKHTFTDLEVHHGNGLTHLYTVEETVPAGYTAAVTGSAAAGYTITNTHAPATVNIPVSKVWEDADNQDGLRPTEITVVLLADGVEIDTYTMTAADNWDHTFVNLQKYRAKADAADAETEIKYTVLEKDIPKGYTAAISHSAAGYTIINTHKAEVAQLNVTKVWADFNDNDGKRPYAVVITLYENGLPTANTVTLSDSNGWKGVWKDMPRYHGGQRISYSVVETGYYKSEDDLNHGVLTAGVPDGYTATHSYDVSNTASPNAIVTNTYTPETTGLNVQKFWDDDDNREGKRPDSITVTLYRKVGESGTWEVMKDSYGNDLTAVLSADNDWEADFLGLPRYSGGKYVYYNVVEAPVAGYEAPKYALDAVNNVVTITNAYKVNRDLSIAVKKDWNDANDQDGIRPDSVTVRLYANGIKTSSTKELNASNGWEAKWTGLYEYYKGQKIVYTVEEETVAEGYTYAITGSAETGFTITNTHAPAKVSIPVIKHWDDNNNQDGKRPAAIVVTLLKNGVTTGKTLTLTAENLWQGEFTDLDKYSAGVTVRYSVEEAKVDGYNLDANGIAQAIVVPAVDGKITITNTHTIEKTKLTAIKIWDDNNDQDGKRPESIVLHLVADGNHMGVSYKRILTAETGWTVTWENLDKYAAGKEIVYTVYEEPIVFDEPAVVEDGIQLLAADGYAPHYVRDSATQVTVTNIYHPEITSVSAMKVWNDDENRDSIRPASITVKLLANGKDTGKTLTLNEANGWTASWIDLPVYENHGTLITYTVEEVDLPKGYECQVTHSGNVFTLTNTHAPATTGVGITKIWADEDNNDGKRPDGIIVQLYADGVAVDGGRIILSDENQWNYTYQSTEQMPLYVFDQGNLVSYYVAEVGYVIDGVEHTGMPDGYHGSTEVGENSYVIAITNTRAAEKVALRVNKQWESNSDYDHDHPASVEVTLLKNGEEVETVTLNEDNNWSCVWADLYRYTAGVENTYTVRETPVQDYSTTYDYKTTDDGKVIDVTVTNVYKTKNVTVRKLWKDNNDEKDLRPDSVTVKLYKNGDAFGDPIILNAANSWKMTLDLPAYEDGTEITWTIREVKVPQHYAASYNQKTLTVTNTLKYEDSPATGDYSHITFWVALMILSTVGLTGLVAARPYMIEDKKRRK